MTKDELYTLAKNEVQYDRQVAIFGQKAANNVLSFWILGYQYKRDELTEVTRDMEMYKEKYMCNQHTVVNQQSTIGNLKAEIEALQKEHIMFAEYINSLDIYMTNEGYWVKNNPAFKDYPTKSTQDLYIEFKQTVKL